MSENCSPSRTRSTCDMFLATIIWVVHFAMLMDNISLGKTFKQAYIMSIVMYAKFVSSILALEVRMLWQ